jgi:hypothetical protein
MCKPCSSAFLLKLQRITHVREKMNAAYLSVFCADADGLHAGFHETSQIAKHRSPDGSTTTNRSEPIFEVFEEPGFRGRSFSSDTVGDCSFRLGA